MEAHQGTTIGAGARPIAVVIPAYKAERHIEQVLRGIPRWISWIVVVDDCSPDDTGRIASAVAIGDARIRVVRHDVNQGVGGATLTGYRLAHQLGAEIVVKMDSDGQMDPAHLRPLIRPIIQGEADYAKGNRFLHSRQLRSMPLLRRVGNLGLSFLTKLASGYWNVFDPTNGYTAIHAALVPALDEASLGRRYFFESSMLAELGLMRAVVRDVSMPARYGDETSHLSVRKTLADFPLRLARCFLRRVWIQYFVRDFAVGSLLGLSGLGLSVFGSAFGVYHWIEAARSGIFAPTGTVMLSVLALVLGVQCQLQALAIDIQNTPTRPIHGDLVLEGSELSPPAAIPIGAAAPRPEGAATAAQRRVA